MTRIGKQEAAAWRSIAEQIDADICNNWHFLCNIVERRYQPIAGALCQVYVNIPSEMRDRMYDRIRSHDFGHSGASYGVPVPWNDGNVPGSDHNRARVLACLWLAHEAEEEG